MNCHLKVITTLSTSSFFLSLTNACSHYTVDFHLDFCFYVVSLFLCRQTIFESSSLPFFFILFCCCCCYSFFSSRSVGDCVHLTILIYIIQCVWDSIWAHYLEFCERECVIAFTSYFYILFLCHHIQCESSTYGSPCLVLGDSWLYTYSISIFPFALSSVIRWFGHRFITENHTTFVESIRKQFSMSVERMVYGIEFVINSRIGIAC